MMEPKTWNFVDKSDWGDGPWQREPDKMEWRDPETGYPCILRRGPQGSLCGYVAVSPGHPMYGKPYSAVDVDVHGGLTFAELCMEDEPETGVCHSPLPGEAANVWWFGWDYAHAFDFNPGLDATMRRISPEIFELFGADPGHYHEWDAVKAEITSAAKQLSEIYVKHAAGIDADLESH